METIKSTRNWLVLALSVFIMAWCASVHGQTRTTTYYHTDALGSIIAASDDQGNLIWEKSYDPYGDPDSNEVISTESGEAFEGQAYTGKPYDDGTGLVYLGQRYYDPELRRFMGIDPVGFKATNPASFNRYTYANNNPYKFVDPDGRQAESALYYGSGGMLAAQTLAEDPELYHTIRSIQNEGHKGTIVGGGLVMGSILAGKAVLAIASRTPNAYMFGVETLAGEAGISYAGAGGTGTAYLLIKGNFHEVLSEVVISGATRTAHRTSANKTFANTLEGDANFAQWMSRLLGKDVLTHMNSGKSGLKNPPGTEWHHPKGIPSIMLLLRREVHRDKSLQGVLHKDGTGGFADHF